MISISFYPPLDFPVVPCGNIDCRSGDHCEAHAYDPQVPPLRREDPKHEIREVEVGRVLRLENVSGFGMVVCLGLLLGLPKRYYIGGSSQGLGFGDSEFKDFGFRDLGVLGV